MNTCELLEISSSIVPDRTAVIFENQKFSYKEINHRSNLLANAFSEMGIEKGDRIALLDVNSNQHIETYFAAAKLDAIYVPINYRLKEVELLKVLEAAKPKIVLFGNRYVKLIHDCVNKIQSVKKYISLETTSGQFIQYETLLTNGNPEEVYPTHEDSDLTMIMFTSGTTGTPKGVMLSHESFTSYTLNNVSPADPEVKESNLLTVPMYHIAGIQAMISGIYAGRTLIIQKQFEPTEWLQLVQDKLVNRAMMVPTMLKTIIEHPNFTDYNLRSLEVITYGAAPMPVTVILDAIDKFPHVKFINAFGQTESGATITALMPDDHKIEGNNTEKNLKIRRLSSIGKPLEDIEIRIVDESGNELKTGNIGEIIARGSRIMKGYWEQTSETSHAIKNNWLHTGDLGYFDNDGYIFLVGRSKDIIKRGGELISPAEIEDIIQKHISIIDCAVIGVPDDQWGEKILAIIVADDSNRVNEEIIIDFCHENLASYKKPESVIFVDAIPRNPLGKINKQFLRDSYG